MRDHQCPIEVCGQTIPLDKLMCRGHWFMVPVELQRQVYRAWRVRLKVVGTDDQPGALRRHAEVAGLAIAHVEERLASR